MQATTNCLRTYVPLASVSGSGKPELCRHTRCIFIQVEPKPLRGACMIEKFTELLVPHDALQFG